MTIRYFSAPCGAGKTRAIVVRAVALADSFSARVSHFLSSRNFTGENGIKTYGNGN
jgi:hypothetical protein